jgi:hypothetical protein
MPAVATSVPSRLVRASISCGVAEISRHRASAGALTRSRQLPDTPHSMRRGGRADRVCAEPKCPDAVGVAYDAVDDPAIWLQAPRERLGATPAGSRSSRSRLGTSGPC